MADSAGLIVLSGVPLGRARSSGPHTGRGLNVDLEGASFSVTIRFIDDLLDCTPLVTWDDVQDSVGMRLQQVPADHALDALMAIEAEAGICTPGGFLDRTGTGKDHRLASMLIVDPSRSGHMVVIGTCVGRNWGRVTAISSASITVVEEYMPLKGEIATSRVVMQLG